MPQVANPDLAPKFTHGQQVLIGPAPADEYTHDTRFVAEVIGYQGYEPPLSYLVAAPDRSPMWVTDLHVAEAPEGWEPQEPKPRPEAA